MTTAGTPLWTLNELKRATGGILDRASNESAEISGLSIDTRTLTPGDLFVALKDVRDGHDFVEAAFKAGAAAALVSKSYQAKPGDGPLLRVPDTLRGLEDIGRAARARLAPDACVIAVTGSVGKTGTKEMLRACCSSAGATHAADKSFNNHWGVPLTLARMPRETRFGIFEIGMNHAGEITPLVAMVRPHVALVTTVEPVHLEHFPNIDGIAEAKAEIFSGLESGGTAIINRDNPYWPILEKAARNKGANIVFFGKDPASDVRALTVTLEPDETRITAQIDSALTYKLATPGAHVAQNSLAVVAALNAAGLDVEKAVKPLATLAPPPGRGSRTRLKVRDGEALLIDESYNANPASMRAALAVLGSVPRDRFPRRIAILGDMLELGPEAKALHAGLAEAIASANVDLLFAAGRDMAHLFEAVPVSKRRAWAEKSDGLKEALFAALEPGDVVMIKGSFGSRMGPIADALRERFRFAKAD